MRGLTKHGAAIQVGATCLRTITKWLEVEVSKALSVLCFPLSGSTHKCIGERELKLTLFSAMSLCEWRFVSCFVVLNTVSGCEDRADHRWFR